MPDLGTIQLTIRMLHIFSQKLWAFCKPATLPTQAWLTLCLAPEGWKFRCKLEILPLSFALSTDTTWCLLPKGLGCFLLENELSNEKSKIL